MLETKEKTIAEIVRDDYRTADVFKKWGINFCCGGNLPLKEVCALQQLNQEAVEAELQLAIQPVHLPRATKFENWSVEFLVDYISHVHHMHLLETMPRLQEVLAKFISGHKKKYPQLEAIQDVFDLLVAEVIEHTAKEEQSLFPYVKQVGRAYREREKYGHLFVRTLSKPIQEVLEADNRRVSSLLTALRQAADDYRFPANACTNHQVIYHKLKEVDADLVQHKHLENNILYPKVIAMEKELLRL